MAREWKLFAVGWPYAASEVEVLEFCRRFAEVESVTLPTERDTNRPRGFAFVKLPNELERDKLLAHLNGREFGGRTLRAEVAKELR